MRLKTVHISNRTKFFWKRVPEPWRRHHKSSSPKVYDRATLLLNLQILTPLTRDIQCENLYLGCVSQSSGADV